jgi:uncharacterized membrane protein YeaQ/YmgE (transglycosylase-associated protein family)
MARSPAGHDSLVMGGTPKEPLPRPYVPVQRVRVRISKTDFKQRNSPMHDIAAQTLIIWLIVGAIAGWLAGVVVRGGGFGLVGDIIVGIIGAFIAGWLFPRMGFHLATGTVGIIIDAAIGAIVLLIIIRIIRRI